MTEQMKLKDLKLRENIRDKGDISELQASIKKHGLIEPLVCRQTKAGVELVCGYRRYAACIQLQMPEVPVVIRKIEDDMVTVIQATENLHRKDMTFMEMARYLTKAVGAGSMQGQAIPNGTFQSRVKVIAEAINKSPKYVHRLVRIMELPKAVLELADKGKLTEAHLRVLLTMPAEHIQRCLDEVIQYNIRDMGGMDTTFPVESIERWAQQRMPKQLEDAPFDTTKPVGDLVACSSCRTNTGADGQLFDTSEKQGAFCRDTRCYRKKLHLHLKNIQAQKTVKGLEFAGWVKPVYDYKTEKIAVPTEIRGSKVIKQPKLLDPKVHTFGLVDDGKNYPVIYLEKMKGKAAEKAKETEPQRQDPKMACFINGIGRELVDFWIEGYLKTFKPTKTDEKEALESALNWEDIETVAREQKTKVNYGNLGYLLAIAQAPAYEVRQKYEKQAVTLLTPLYAEYKERLAKEKGYELPEDIKQAVLKKLLK